ncbi:hypothetical protein CCR94_16700 [Rhodoblastus sphagnicola]|uniref:LytTR family transcriptional regulator n=1 Tax=Rhodoblastus sphagnicola TaxID=333368 RepID=A0A2S6N355_9HYPH|nr:DUF4159 domain-containing protein [Rhodoblastus sphagnicola]MBB4199137.1 hypothetical protein [Rhodoblastus sphagnicola]PPQ29026.1 hypothetical protein CCR94_16700 [Rhodoblastus sphagnicola]
MNLLLAFSSPWILLALAGAPALYFLLRVTPPPPKQIAFPPLKLILGERRDDATPARTPLWLLLLRMALAALIVLAMAGPTLNPPGAAGGRGPLLLLIDNFWTAAPDFSARQAAATRLLEAAARENRPAAVLGLAEKPFISLEDPGAALARLRALTPRPYLPPRAPSLPAIETFLREHGGDLVWLSDGQQDADGRAFAEKISALAPGAALLTGDRPPRALTGARNGSDALEVDVLRAQNGAPEGVVRAFDAHGAPLGDSAFTFGADNHAIARLTLPLQLRNDVARLALLGEASAGGVFLLDSGARRRRVGLVGGAKPDQPLLSPLYYLRKALLPHADLREEKPGEPDPIGRLIGEGADVLILADMVLAPDAREKLKKFLDAGGTVVRFAGPHLAAAPDDLLPVKLRRGGRTLGGALSWERPKTLAPFDEGGPFAGLTPPADANVSRQILAEPEPGLPQKTWARLADGTPLVTAEARGAGALILFHIAAENSWSNLPLSGLFVDMLKKILARAGAVGPVSSAQGEGLLPVLKNLDGFGTLGPPATEARALPAKGETTPDAEHPPGYYGAAEAPRALNAFADQAFKPLDLSGLGFNAQNLGAAREKIDLRGPLLLLAALLALADAFAAFWLGDSWRRQAAPVALALLVLLAPPPARAQEAKSYQPALTPSLAYVVTGDSHADRISALGLKSLSETVSQRTSFNPGAPRAVDPARDELAFYPMLYWPVSPDAPQPSAQVAQKIAAYMKQGGLLLFDTRDAAQQFEGGETTPAQDWLKLFLQKLDPPPLAPAPRNHVIFRTFYLLEGFAGRVENGPVYIEALPPDNEGEKAPARAGDGVSPVIIASTDLAAGWASDQWGEALYPSGGDAIRSHELALRGGVNIVMYTLTGNYKADQVHVPELLERLGQ